ncbi:MULTISPECIES: PAS domain-containing protein [unclassified Streptomyces]|uniref:PAS domain-containing protein n=1 Tax=unclassified Streptomyces TaxID=2593676 RepID=UPI002366BF16|nr:MULTISPECIES: PAS domain-containing protein [unclassified Streptomyces]MDF3141175.1 PAS domain-containing protein [Streptomyces sp. T21Q-yed]WDF42666.1 PAS domain-containing protein [Streptomyces sp. T12]
MAQTDEFGEELADFVRRVAELKAARSLSGGDLPTVLDAAIFELDHVADQLWPRYERLSSGYTGSSGGLPRTASADRQEHHLLRAVFQRFPLPVALVDREAVVRRLNFAATSFTGVRAGYATGRPLTGFLAHADRAAFRSQAAAVARGEGDRSLTVRLLQRPSTPVHATLTAVRPSGEPHTTVLVVLQPGEPTPAATPTAQVPDLAETTRHVALTDLQDEMTATLLTAPRGDRDAVVRRAAQVLHGRFADWVIVDTGAARMSRTAVLAPSEKEAAALAEQDPATCPLATETTRTGSPSLQIRPEDPDAFGRDGEGAPVLVQANVTSLLCVPLVADRAVQGVLTLFRCGARLAFSMAEAKAMDTMSRHITLAATAAP